MEEPYPVFTSLSENAWRLRRDSPLTNTSIQMGLFSAQGRRTLSFLCYFITRKCNRTEADVSPKWQQDWSGIFLGGSYPSFFTSLSENAQWLWQDISFKSHQDWNGASLSSVERESYSSFTSPSKNAPELRWNVATKRHQDRNRSFLGLGKRELYLFFVISQPKNPTGLRQTWPLRTPVFRTGFSGLGEKEDLILPLLLHYQKIYQDCDGHHP